MTGVENTQFLERLLKVGIPKDWEIKLVGYWAYRATHTSGISVLLACIHEAYRWIGCYCSITNAASKLILKRYNKLNKNFWTLERAKELLGETVLECTEDGEYYSKGWVRWPEYTSRPKRACVAVLFGAALSPSGQLICYRAGCIQRIETESQLFTFRTTIVAPDAINEKRDRLLNRRSNKAKKKRYEAAMKLGKKMAAELKYDATCERKSIALKAYHARKKAEEAAKLNPGGYTADNKDNDINEPC